VGTDCGQGSTLEALPLRKGYYRLDAASIDVRVCPDAQTNCSTTFGTSECESASGCQGGVGDPCANNLTGVFCLLCNRSDLNTPVYYRPSTGNGVARCVECGDTLADTALVALSILAAVVFVLLLLHRLSHKLSSETVTFLKEIYAAYTPRSKLKIAFGPSS
jgi:hypothetical protein